MPSQATKYVLPQLNLTTLSSESDPLSYKISIGTKSNNTAIAYFVKPKLVPSVGPIRNIRDHLKNLEVKLFPVVTDDKGAPWPEANLWLISRILERDNPNMVSLQTVSADLVSYLRFIEENKIDWLNFPESKIHKPTHRYNAYLKMLVQSEKCAVSTAKRKMGTVIGFYKWLRDEKLFIPSFPLWNESEVYVRTNDLYGDKLFKKVVTTDVTIKIPQQEDPYSEFIQDGGKLRPLTQDEQDWLLKALVSLGNMEILLIHLFGLLTGARLQTILTFRVSDVLKESYQDFQGYIRYPVGPGTGIDTKFDKRQVLHIPIWFYERLRIYALGNQAKTRRMRAVGGDVLNQYLFLTEKGAPFYEAKTQLPEEGANELRHKKTGQAVRQYITEFVIPYIRQEFSAKFHYSPHDLRATYGMNLVDDKMKLFEQGKMSMQEILNFVQVRMGHSSFLTTERYLTYRGRLLIVRHVQDGWEAKLTELAKNAMGGENE